MEKKIPWFDTQDLHVDEILPQMITLSTSYIQVRNVHGYLRGVRSSPVCGPLPPHRATAAHPEPWLLTRLPVVPRRCGSVSRTRPRSLRNLRSRHRHRHRHRSQQRVRPKTAALPLRWSRMPSRPGPARPSTPPPRRRLRAGVTLICPGCLPPGKPSQLLSTRCRDEKSALVVSRDTSGPPKKKAGHGVYLFIRDAARAVPGTSSSCSLLGRREADAVLHPVVLKTDG